MITSSLLPQLLLVALASARPNDIYNNWKAPGPDDFRGPCPMMNTLANHHFLHHDGKNLTQDVVVNALHKALNFDPFLGNIMFEQALPANPDPNATFFTLDMLNRHNVLEHDASLSRSDAYFGNNHIFNQTIFDESTKYWTGPTIDRAMMANSKMARQLQSKASNPTYRFTNTTDAFSTGEILAPFIAFGDRDAVTVDKERVEYFFRNERLPTCLGWTTPAAVNLTDITRLTEIFDEATTLITSDGTTSASHAKRADSHFGIGI